MDTLRDISGDEANLVPDNPVVTSAGGDYVKTSAGGDYVVTSASS